MLIALRNTCQTSWLWGVNFLFLVDKWGQEGKQHNQCMYCFVLVFRNLVLNLLGVHNVILCRRKLYTHIYRKVWTNDFQWAISKLDLNAASPEKHKKIRELINKLSRNFLLYFRSFISFSNVVFTLHYRV